MDKFFLIKNNNNIDVKKNMPSFNNSRYRNVYMLSMLNNLYTYNNLITSMVCKFNVTFINQNISEGVLKRNNFYYYLELMFSRNRFFPQLFNNLTGKTIFNVSLGMVSNYFSKKKNFLRSKASYLILAVYLRRILVNIRMFNVNLKVKGLPIYLSSILKSLLTKSNVIYKNPFKDNAFVNEIVATQNLIFNFSYVIFINNKNFNQTKTKKKGRLKRKI